MSALTVVLTAACSLLLLETSLLFVHLGRLRRLSRSTAPEPTAWPLVSVVMAARDEARDVASSVASRLAEGYPALELILVDDRSEDGTGSLALAAAAGDPRLTVVRVDELPAGWLGKVHALHQGVQRARGDFVLFSDGDVSVRPGTLRLAVAHCLAGELDQLALMPAFHTGSVLVDAIWAVFLRGMLVLIDPGAVRDPRSRVAMGSGGFNLVRRAAFDRTPGFEHLRLETGDDVALAQMVKRAGGKLDFVDGSDLVSVPMYRSVGAFLRGIEKNGSTLARVPAAVVAGALTLLWSLVFAPLVALATGPAWLSAVGAVSLCAYVAGELVSLHRNTRRWLPALLWPLGGLLMSYGLVRAAWLVRRNGGVSWRGTFYTLEELKRHRRI